MMLTRCPTCSTAFRVTPEQLKARAGKVRCGHCNAVFNALETLEDTPPAAQAGTATSPAETGVAEPPAEPPHAEAPPDASPPALQAEAEKSAEGESIDILLEEIDEAPPRAARGRLIAWSAAALLALGVLVVQAAHVFRAELAVSQPELRPLLEDLCGLLECDIPLPRKAEFVSIEASDLHPDAQKKNLLVLTATLKNRAPFAQGYPFLEVTLTDTGDQAMVRKVLAPAEYLPEGTDAQAGFAGNAELAIHLWLDAGGLGASGYRLYLFYP
ncbi:MAG: zinc-ribbon domain-containing protein [Burkholderiales bacterium]|nr:zinc-ribbon domain-containing protein [Burkholderiales bacterium]